MWFALALLPDAHAAPIKCLTRPQGPDPLGTPVMLAAAGPPRPNSVGYIDSAIYPIRVHYRDAADAEKAELLVLPNAEISWQVEVEQMGWPAPPPDNGVGGSDAYDYYLTNQGTFGGAYTYGTGPDVIPDDNWYSVPSYIAIDEDYINGNLMPTFVSHEFNHALQYTIDANERRIFPWESTAEAMTDLVFDDDNEYLFEIVDFNEFPFLSLLFDGYSAPVYAYDDYSYYEYGGMEFGMFLEEYYGATDGTTLLAVWDALAQPSTAAQPDFLDGLATLEPPGALYTEFAVWRMFVASDDDGTHFEEGASWRDNARVPAEATLLYDEIDGYSAAPMYPPYDLGTTYYEIPIPPGTTDTLHVQVQGDEPVQWGIAWAVWPEDDGPALTGTFLANPGDVAEADIPLTGGKKAKFGVVDAGPPDMDGTVAIPRRMFAVDLSLIAGVPTGTTPTTSPSTTPPDETGDGPSAPPEDDKGGCGCGASPAPSGLLLVPLALVLRRRRS